MSGEDLDEWHELLAAYRAVPKENRAAALELVKATSKLGPNAVEILRKQGAGLVRGLPYGDWNDARDMIKECISEARDGANYARREWIRLEAVMKAHALFVEAHDALLVAASQK